MSDAQIRGFLQSTLAKAGGSDVSGRPSPSSVRISYYRTPGGRDVASVKFGHAGLRARLVEVPLPPR